VFYEPISDDVLWRIVSVVERDNNIREAWNILKRLGLAMLHSDKPMEELLEEIIR